MVALHTLLIIASNRPAMDMAGSTSRPFPAPPVADTAAPPPMDIVAALERLAELHHRGILSEEECTTKKAELLRRL